MENWITFWEIMNEKLCIVLIHHISVQVKCHSTLNKSFLSEDFQVKCNNERKYTKIQRNYLKKKQTVNRVQTEDTELPVHTHENLKHNLNLTG